MLEKAAADYEHVYQLQSTRLSQLGQHPLGELLFGIADTNSRLGNQERAAEFFDKIDSLLPNTPYAKRAALRARGEIGTDRANALHRLSHCRRNMKVH